MFLKAICDCVPCLVNTDYIMEVYDLDKEKVRAYTIEDKYPYYIKREEWNRFMEEDDAM